MSYLKICCLFFVLYQSGTDTRHITERYQEINARIGTYRQVVVDTEERSTEGGEVTGYFSGDSIMLITEDVYGEMGKKRTEIYYDHGTPVFIYRRDYHYSVPMYDNTFSNANISVEEDRVYFRKGNMIKWINKKKVPLTKRDPSFTAYEQRLLKYAARLHLRLNPS
ncbi:hypothetical protein PV783_33205 [Chitinophaga sp. CC14]|uniref:hypothetical protein n=1 Tax=Chitinophaga sp. CC14 TaxID=3029199 RepID=UPI003B78B442